MGGRLVKYLAIKDDLARRIESREFAPGGPLPSQAALSKEYGVTLMTLRQALRGLEDENVIVQEPGRGTFVRAAPPSDPTLDLRNLTSLVAELEAQGIALETHVLGSGHGVVPHAVADALDLPSEASGLRLERLRTVADVPVVHQISWVPHPWGVRISDVDFRSSSLYDALAERCGIMVASADETLQARSLSRPAARATGGRPGKAVLVAERVTYDGRLRAVVHDSVTILESTVRLMIHRAPRRVRTNWAAGPFVIPSAGRGIPSVSGWSR